MKYRQPGYRDGEYKEEREKRREADRGPPRGARRESQPRTRRLRGAVQEEVTRPATVRHRVPAGGRIVGAVPDTSPGRMTRRSMHLTVPPHRRPKPVRAAASVLVLVS